MAEPPHATQDELNAGLDAIRRSPADAGPVELIVRRPATNQREVLDSAELDTDVGLVGDCWATKSGRKPSNPATHLTLMNARAAALVAREGDRWPLAGDQLYVDLDLSLTNLPPGTRLSLGTAELEVAVTPHLGCEKFTARFGAEARLFVNSPEGKHLRLRGMYARVVRPGVVRVGDLVRKVGGPLPDDA